MARATPIGPCVEVEVIFTLPERVLNWAIAQASEQKVTDIDHIIAILVSAHREARVVSVKLPKGEGSQKNDSVRVGGGSKESLG